MRTDYDAIIIGAGPAGCSAAIMLASAGWRVAVVEKKDFPRRKVCGECIAASNLPLLEALGVWPVFSRLAGPPLRSIAVIYRDRMIVAPMPRQRHDAHRWGVALNRALLDELLLKRAAECGAEVFQPWVARSIDGAPGRYRCGLVNAHAGGAMLLEAPVLIDAHGSWEPCGDQQARQSEQLRRRGSDLFAFKAHFIGADVPSGMLPVLSFDGGYGGMVIGDHARATLAFCMRRDTLALCRRAMPRQKAAEAAMAYLQSVCPQARSMLSNAARHDAWLSVGPIRPGIRIRAGGPFLIGNAAAEAHPIIGEGISMAIQSAWLLARLLAPQRGRVGDAALLWSLQREYARSWRHHFAPRLRLAAMFAHVAMRPALAGCMLPLLQSWPSLLTHAARWSGKVSLPPETPPSAGRLPDINKRAV